LADAIERLDTLRGDEDIEVLLIAVPSYRLEFFLLLDGERAEVYVISCAKEGRGLAEDRFYSEDEFLEKLAAEPPHTGLLISPAP
jgi:hypothetical protein